MGTRDERLRDTEVRNQGFMSKFRNKHEAKIVMEEWFSRHCIDDAMGVFGTQVWS